MYERHFGFSLPPFQVTPDPNLLLLTAAHREAIAAIMYAIMSRKGFATVTGDVGVGKTSVLRHALDRVAEAGKLDIIYLVQPIANPVDLLRTIWRELAQEGEALGEHYDMGVVIDDIHAKLLTRFQRQRNVVLAIDEAQALPVAALEALRLLSNFEAHRSKLLQIVLVGQTELEQMLARPELRQLDQRIAIRARIHPLGRRDSLRYVRFRLAAAAETEVRPFTAPALYRLLREARGYPRRLNILCDNALMNAYGHSARRVTWRIAREACNAQAPAARRSARGPAAAGVAVAALLIPAASLVGLPDLRDRMWTMADGARLPTLERAKEEALQEAARLKEFASVGIKAATEGVSKVAATVPWADAGAGAPSMAGADAEAEAEAREEPALPTPTVALPPVREEAKAARTIAAAPAPPTPTVAPPPAREEVKAATAAAAPAQPQRKTKQVEVVRRGETVTQMCQRIYGRCGGEEMRRIREANPDIRNLSRIMVGQTIVFPGNRQTAASR
jgi:general secretion pathway protein A